ncbi:hypothetical protein BS47DRAFT_1361466 [Hydnum rufescens UP504]|uniref:Uncharacterized protein n=1 Tax=Hydnum rufescens UP504 TaxID=1448309 RepID=A0A9P6AZ80_9AGAM|nr:hypothetical protein BS47DRAFT_1361466 [Hydnum rufescens UP504]
MHTAPVQELEEVTETKTAKNRAKQQETKNRSGKKEAPSDRDHGGLYHLDDGERTKKKKLSGGWSSETVSAGAGNLARENQAPGPTVREPARVVLVPQTTPWASRERENPICLVLGCGRCRERRLPLWKSIPIPDYFVNDYSVTHPRLTQFHDQPGSKKHEIYLTPSPIVLLDL